MITARFVGRCKKCKTPLAVMCSRVHSPHSLRAEWVMPSGERWTPRPGTLDAARTFVPCWTCAAFSLQKGGRERYVELRRVVGHKTDEPCSPKCTGATGFQCECACGGANHGGAI